MLPFSIPRFRPVVLCAGFLFLLLNSWLNSFGFVLIVLSFFVMSISNVRQDLGDFGQLIMFKGVARKLSQRAHLTTGKGLMNSMIQKLREELLAQLDSQGETVLISCIDQLMQAKDSAGAIALLQVLGKDKAFAIYKKLSLAYQTHISDCLKRANYQGSDVKLMIDMGLYLQNKLTLARGWRQLQDGLDQHISQLILGLQRTDLLQLCKTMLGDVLVRFLIYLDPKQLADLLRECRDHEPAGFTQLSHALVRLPEAKSLGAYDAEILTKIQDYHTQANSEEQLGYLRYLQAVLANSETQLADELVDVLHKKHPRLGLNLVKNVNHLEEFIKLPPSIQQRFLASLSPRELGCLLVGLEPHLRQLFGKNLDSKCLPKVRAELSQVLNLSNRQLVSLHKEAKQSLQHQLQSFSELMADKQQGYLV
ncbi:MAG: hypothetical protein NTX25_22820 [Proteobacteria bacterium]|nr:hypothetical protein [Pseudomonadota bacterium]